MDEITIIPALLCDSEIWTTSSGHLKASWGISSKSIKFTEGWANGNYQLLPNNLPQSRGPSCTLSSIGQAKSFPWQHQTTDNYFLFQALFRDEGREDFSRIEKIFQGSAHIFLGAMGEMQLHRQFLGISTPSLLKLRRNIQGWYWEHWVYALVTHRYPV